MNAASQVTVVIPSLNPDEKLKQTVNSLIQLGFQHILCVNDGSKAECVPNFPQNIPECTVLVHKTNQGKGAAMKTAFRYILDSGIKTAGVITVDGDGQHRAEDVLRCAEAMLQTHTVVLGVRNFDLPQVPKRSRFGNKMTSLTFRVFCGLKISDTQTGLRAIPTEYLARMLEIHGDRYEYETNMLLQFQSLNIPCSETVIETVYIEDNQTSHFRPVRDSLRIYGLILKFVSSSLISSVVDLTAFFLLSLFLPTLCGIAADAISTVLARLISSSVNFSINHCRVFQSKAPLKRTLIRYYILAVSILILSSASITALSILFDLGNPDYAFIKTILKFLIDSVLFLVSFRVQREWVFSNRQ